MRARYLMPLVPLAAIWTYAVGNSLAELHALIADAGVAEPAAAPVPHARPSVPRSSSASSAIDTAHGERPERRAPPDRRARTLDERPPPPAAEAEIAVAPNVPPAPSGTEEAPIEHPEITDPAMRRLLAPAWAD